MGLKKLTQRALLLVVAAMLALSGIDGGSIYLTRLQLPDDVEAAGYAATEVSVKGQVNRQTAVAAWRAAEDEAQTQGFAVEAKDFTIYPDGRVTLTGTKNAPTLLLHRVHALRHLLRVTDTETVTALPYASAPQLNRRTR
jgi:hypothetical protein